MPVKIHGKDYYTVAERIQKLNDTYKDKYSITTELIRCADSIVIMKATLTFHLGVDDVRTFDGYAMEEIGSSMINKTSALENAETSAIGRCLAAASFAGTEYCSADELANALLNQTAFYPSNQTKKPETETTKSMNIDEADHMLSDEAKERFDGKTISDGNIINFGKHKGKDWSEVADEYINWCITKSTADFVKEQAQDEYNRRNKQSTESIEVDEKIPF